MDDFVPATFTVPTTLVGDGFRLIPLGPEHNASDYDAWMSSIDHIRATPGFPDGNWPAPMTAAENRGDLERHRADFEQRQGFTYTVLDDADREADVVIGCVYIYPSTVPGVDADVRSWVRADRAHLDRRLYDAVSTWLAAAWPFRAIEYVPRPVE
jgi:hypothetical protein